MKMFAALYRVLGRRCRVGVGRRCRVGAYRSRVQGKAWGAGRKRACRVPTHSRRVAAIMQAPSIGAHIYEADIYKWGIYTRAAIYIAHAVHTCSTLRSRCRMLRSWSDCTPRHIWTKRDHTCLGSLRVRVRDRD